MRGIDLEEVVLVGERILLRPQTPAHAGAAFDAIHGDDEILRWLVWEGPETAADLEELYSAWKIPSEEGNDYFLVILDKDTESFLGSIGVRFAGRRGIGDVGYWVARSAWGRGVATEAVRLVTHLSFRHLEAPCLSARVFAGNDASRAVLEKNGFALVRTARDKVEKRGAILDEWQFTLLRDEWARNPELWEPRSERVGWETP